MHDKKIITGLHGVFFRKSDPIETLQGEKKRGIIAGDKLPAGNLPAIKIRSPHRPPKN